MKLKELEEYNHLTYVAIMARNMLEEIEEKKRKISVVDSVSGSMTEFPYVQRTVKIEGVDETTLLQLEQQRAETERQLAAIEKKRRKIEKWVNGVRDPFIRGLMIRRVIEFKTWEKCSLVCTNGQVSGDTLRKQMSAYVARHPEG